MFKERTTYVQRDFLSVIRNFTEVYPKIPLVILLLFFSFQGCSQPQNHLKINESKTMNYKKLTPEEERVILYKGTEAPFTGKYEKFEEVGTYVCKRCATPLYRSTDKFDAHCGWPAFDDEIEGAVKRIPDADGFRTEIVCAACGGHLGHVFLGEGFTSKNTRHCVNSISLEFIPASDEGVGQKTDTAIFAGGCFWGVEYYMKKINGVISTEVGYTGGYTKNPTYKEVCDGKTGHYEAIEVVFDPSKTSFETVARMFFETHDPTQWNHQGPDYGQQYRSAVFYRNDAQKTVTEKLIGELKSKGFKVVTEVKPASTFWKAEDYHQDYYENKGAEPYCHGYVKRF
jgi:peptide methionine sulfoxide reductase msrA/msrB